MQIGTKQTVYRDDPKSDVEMTQDGKLRFELGDNYKCN